MRATQMDFFGKHEVYEDAIDKEIESLTEEILLDAKNLQAFMYYNDEKLTCLFSMLVMLSKKDATVKNELRHLVWSWASVKAKENVHMQRERYQEYSEA